MLNQFDCYPIYYGNNNGNDSDFVEEKREAPLFDEAKHDKVHKYRKNESVSKFIGWNTKDGMRLETSIARGTKHQYENCPRKRGQLMFQY